MKELNCNSVNRIVFRIDHLAGEEEENATLLSMMITKLFNHYILYHNQGDGTIVLYSFIPKSILDKIIASLEHHQMLISVEDVTCKIFSGEAEEDIALDFLLKSNMKNRIILEEFKRKNMTLDNVLDRIAYKGMDSLTQVEINILKNEALK